MGGSYFLKSYFAGVIIEADLEFIKDVRTTKDCRKMNIEVSN